MPFILNNGLELYFLVLLLPFLSSYELLDRPAVIVVAFHLMIAMFFISRLRISKNEMKFFVSLVFLFVLILITSIFSLNTFESLINMGAFFVSAFCLFVIYTGSKINSKKKIFDILKMLSFIGLIFSFFFIIISKFGTIVNYGEQTFQQISIGGLVIKQVVLYKNGGFIGASWTNSTNTLGVLLMVTLGATLVSLLREKKYHYLFSGILQVYTLIQSDSRTAIIATFFFVLFFFWGCSNNQIKIWIGITLSGIMLILCLFLIINFRYLNWDSITTNRTWAWSYGMSLLSGKYITGMGFGVPHGLIAAHLGIGVHNVFLSLVLQFGIIIMALIVSYWIFSIIKSFKLTETNSKLIYSYCFAFLASLFIHQLFEEHIFRFNIISFYWIFIMLIVFDNKKIEGQGEKNDKV